MVRARTPTRPTSERTVDLRARRLARTVLTSTLRVGPGESVTVEAWTEALPWASAFVEESYRLRARPCLLHRDRAALTGLLRASGDPAVALYGPVEWAILEKTDAYVSFVNPMDLASAPGLAERVGAPFEAQEERRRRIAARTGMRSASIYLGRVTREAVGRFHVPARTWQRELVDGALVEPARMHAVGARLAAALERGRTLDIRHRNGTRLAAGLKGRPAWVFGGLLDHATERRLPRPNEPPMILETPIPAGFVASALDEDRADGAFVSNLPGEQSGESLTRSSGGRWSFEEGRLVRATFRSGQTEFDRGFGAGEGGRDRPAFLTVGLNPCIHAAPWMVDQGLGVVTLGLGGNGHLGGATRIRFHSALYLAGATVLVDGRPLLRGGRPVA